LAEVSGVLCGSLLTGRLPRSGSRCRGRPVLENRDAGPQLGQMSVRLEPASVQPVELHGAEKNIGMQLPQKQMLAADAARRVVIARGAVREVSGARDDRRAT